jgi:tRNA pseudouridine32 synthase/23S rRNA pseudouridine746 synthase
MYSLIENNEYFLVVYKQPGSSFHREEGVPGLFETVKKNEMLEELYPVHRLDKVTSGLLVMAKTAATNQALVSLFAERKVEKYYLAISDKKPKKKQGLVKGDMERTRRSAWKLLPTDKNPAVSQFFSTSLGEGKRLFLIKPYTGKTHQIRVALKSLGAPILGDELYGASDVSVDRTYLHAYSLAFSLAGKDYRFKILPREGEFFLSPEFLTVVETFAQPQALPWPRI